MDHHRLGYDARLSVEYGMQRDDDEFITLRLDPDNDWQIETYPWEARDLAKRLVKMANLIDPPKPRKRSG